MAQDLSILLSARLDKTQSEADINKQIRRLENQLNAVNLKFNLDNKTLVILKNFSDAMNKVKSSTKELNRVFKEEETTIKKLDGSTEKQIRQHLKNGEIIEKYKKIIKENSDATNEQSKAIDKQTQKLQEFNDALEKQGELQKRISRENANGYNGGSEKYKSGFNDISYGINKDALVTSIKTTENIDKERQAVERLTNGLGNLRRVGILSKEELVSLGDQITNGNVDSALASYNRLVEKQKEIIRLRNLGNQKTTVSPSIFQGGYDTTKNSLEQVLRDTYKAQGASEDLERTMVSLSRAYDKAGNEVWKYNVAIKNSDGVAHQYKGSVDALTRSIYENATKTSDATNRSLSVLQQFKIALARVPVWLGKLNCPIY